MRLLPIVEGQGDMQAVPLLLRRVLHEVCARFDVEVLQVQKRGEWPRVKRDFDRMYRSARIESTSILWVVDFDCEECLDPIIERNWLRQQVARIDPSGRVEIVFMIQEYESLFLSDPSCICSSYPELSETTTFPSEPEAVRDAKGWISNALPKGRAYKPTTDQAKLTSRLDLNRLRQTSSSYRRFEKAVISLI